MVRRSYWLLFLVCGCVDLTQPQIADAGASVDGLQNEDAATESLGDGQRPNGSAVDTDQLDERDIRDSGADSARLQNGEPCQQNEACLSGLCTAGRCAAPPICMPERDDLFCARLKKNCGALDGVDNCGQPRTVASCGNCSSPQTCGGTGTKNVCGCAPESDASLCARLGKNCGSALGIDNCGQSRLIFSCGTCPTTCVDGGTTSGCVAAQCSFAVTRQSYDGSQRSGTLTIRNDGPAQASNFRIEFDVPNSQCNSASAGWSFSANGSHCVYSKPGTSVAAGGTVTFNYSTSSSSSAINIVVHDTVCAP